MAIKKSTSAKLKSFDTYIETRLTKKEITLIEKQAKLEKKLFDMWQEAITQTIDSYMKKNNVGFNDLVKILNISPTQISKIQKGQANLTLATMAHIFTTLNEMPQLIFKKK